MPRGDIIANNSSVSKKVEKLLAEGCSYKKIRKVLKKKFNLEISLGVIHGFKWNYVMGIHGGIKRQREFIEPESILDKKKYLEKKMKQISRPNKVQWIADKYALMNFYETRLSMIEEELDKVAVKKAKSKEDQDYFRYLMDLDRKYLSDIITMFYSERRREEIFQLINGIVDVVINIFIQKLPVEKREVCVKDFQLALRRIVNQAKIDMK